MKIDHVNIVVSDMEEAIAFYGDLLGLDKTFDVILEGEWIETVAGLPDLKARCVFFFPKTGTMRLEVLQFFSPQGVAFEANKLPNTLGLRHVALEVDDLEEFRTRLEKAGVQFLSPTVTVPFPVANRGTKQIAYFYGPDNVLLEVAAYSQ